MKKPNQFKILERYIEGIVKGYAHSLVVLGKAGIGKTETTIKTLERLGLREGQEYLYLNGHITPLQLFKELKRINELNEPKIGVIDDCEIMLKDMKSVGLLKGALWQLPNGARKVSWYSTSWKVETKSFYFNGRIIFLINSILKDNPIVKAFIDRGLFYHISFTNQELLDLMRERAKSCLLYTSPSPRDS